MKRSKFLKILGIGAAAAVAAPLVIAEVLKPEVKIFDYANQYNPEGMVSFTDINGNTYWYTEWDMLQRQKYHDKMQMKLLNKWGDHSLSEFLHKTGSSI